MSITAADIKGAIRSFKPGSAGGRDGLRPQHLRDMIDDRVGGDLCEALAEFANLVLGGGVPESVRPVFSERRSTRSTAAFGPLLWVSLHVALSPGQ